MYHKKEYFYIREKKSWEEWFLCKSMGIERSVKREDEWTRKNGTKT